MKTYYHLIHCWILMAALGSSVWAEEGPPLFYPFEVTIGGHEAKMKNGEDLFAVIEEPVKGKDLLKIEERAEILIANASPCEEDGMILDVVAHGRSSCVVFTIVDPEGKMNFSKLGDLLKYLKGKS